MRVKSERMGVLGRLPVRRINRTEEYVKERGERVCVNVAYRKCMNKEN